MPKKESTERGYMTKKDIYSHLDGLKTEEGKAQYLDKILSKKGLLAPETYNSVQKVANEMYEKTALDFLEKGKINQALKYAEKRGNKKLVDKICVESALSWAKSSFLEFNSGNRHAIYDGERCLRSFEEYADKISDKKLRDEIYEKIAVKAAKEGWFNKAGEFAKEAGNNKLADKIYKKAALRMSHGVITAGKYAHEISDKKLKEEIYGKITIKAAKEGRFDFAEGFAEKAKEYLKQKHPKILANIYEKTGKVIKAKDIRKKLEAKETKK